MSDAAKTESLNAHARPPDVLKLLFKKWQKAQPQELVTGGGLLDTAELDGKDTPGLTSRAHSYRTRLVEAFERFCPGYKAEGTSVSPSAFCYEVDSLPGLILYPRLFPVEIQSKLLDKILHRDAIHPSHKTNLHLFYDMSPLFEPNVDQEQNEESRSLFSLAPGVKIYPKDPQVHKPLSVVQIANRKLRWTTLGGQYDWTAKTYPEETPEIFPPDIRDLLCAAFPQVDPQAAILNFYSPGDTLSLHRDVSEECDRDLISLSIGCDCIFIAASEDGRKTTTLRLRSGDVLLMSGQARFAWHGVPKVIKGTCPEELRNWPVKDRSNDYASWKGWLADKRINLNVRQMKEECTTRSPESGPQILPE